MSRDAFTIHDTKKLLAAANSKAEAKTEELRVATKARTTALNDLHNAKQKLSEVEGSLAAQQESLNQRLSDVTKGSDDGHKLQVDALKEQLEGIRACVERLKEGEANLTTKLEESEDSVRVIRMECTQLKIALDRAKEQEAVARRDWEKSNGDLKMSNKMHDKRLQTIDSAHEQVLEGLKKMNVRDRETQKGLTTNCKRQKKRKPGPKQTSTN